MSFTNLVVSARYTPNGSNDTFAIPFAFVTGDTTTIKVYEINTSTGVKTLKTLTTHYTLSPAGDSPTNVVYNTAPAASVGKVSIERVLPLTQAVDYIGTGRFPAQTHENGMDKLVQIVQQLNERLDRTLEFSVLDKDSGVSFTLPPITANPGEYLRINDAGDGFEWAENIEAIASPMTTRGDMITRDDNNTIRLALGAANYVLKSDGTDPGWALITNAMIDAAAAIARSKIAAGTADHALINDGSGNMSSEAQLAISRGGTGQATANAAFAALSPMTTNGDLITRAGGVPTRLAPGTDGYVLQMSSGAPAWAQKVTGELIGYQVFTANGTYTKNANANYIRVIVVGGGGGGGGSFSDNYGIGYGGGGGGCSMKKIANGSVGATEAVTVGSGGTCAGGTSSGTAGGSSSFGAHCSATGGGGGTVLSNVAGASGGVGSGGDHNFYGGPGGVGNDYGADNYGGGGVGGNSFFGGGANSVGNDTVGANGANYGGGGGGGHRNATTSRAGGTGGGGVVIVEEYA